MKLFLVEVETKPCSTFRLQFGTSLASVAMMAENGKLPVISIKQISDDVGNHNGTGYGCIPFGFQNIVMNGGAQ